MGCCFKEPQSCAMFYRCIVGMVDNALWSHAYASGRNGCLCLWMRLSQREISWVQLSKGFDVVSCRCRLSFVYLHNDMLFSILTDSHSLFAEFFCIRNCPISANVYLILYGSIVYGLICKKLWKFVLSISVTWIFASWLSIYVSYVCFAGLSVFYLVLFLPYWHLLYLYFVFFW